MNIVEEIKNDLKKEEKNRELSNLTIVNFDYLVNELKKVFKEHELIKVTNYTNNIYLYKAIDEYNSYYLLIKKEELNKLKVKYDLKIEDTKLCKAIHLYSDYDMKSKLISSSDISLNTCIYSSKSKEDNADNVKLYDNAKYIFTPKIGTCKTPFILNSLNDNYDQKELDKICLKMIKRIIDNKKKYAKSRLDFYKTIKNKLVNNIELNESEKEYIITYISNDEEKIKDNVLLLKK